MKNIVATTFIALALILSAPAIAQDADTAEKTSELEKAPHDPVRLAAAAKTVDYLFPLGTYERMMKGTMDQLMDSMLASMGEMKIGDMVGASGIPDTGMTGEQKDQSIGNAARQADPHFDERMKISTRVMMDEMVDLMSKMEPEIRAALSKIYARKFTVSQLTEMSAFFATDTGSTFARDYMMVFVDPEMMQSMMRMVPEMMQAMPSVLEKVKEATEHLPPPTKSADQINTEDNAEMADALSKDMDDEAKWSQPENWSEQERALVEKTEAEYDAAFDTFYNAQSKAQENAEKRLKKDD